MSISANPNTEACILEWWRYNTPMNYLAHTLLSKNLIDYQIANLSADALKSRTWAGCSQAHREGISMHKAIDRFTDSNTHVARAKSRLGPGYLKGVVMDITFDHFITKHWHRYTNIAFATFVQNFHDKAVQALDTLPPDGQRFIQRAVKHEFLFQYRHFSDLHHVFERVNQRLSDKILAKESATDYLMPLTEHYLAIESDFLQFFPELINHFLEVSQATSDEHFLLNT